MSARSVSSLPVMSEASHCLSHSVSLPVSQSYSRCDELRVRIHENHLSYLNREETPAKLEMRTKIECLIAEYLSLVPNTHKFSFPEVSECLNRSITENKDFSAYKACNALEALEKYATNLITLPWRTEYHHICAYSGFYRHVIDKHLVGAHHILELMGFVERSKGIYQLVPPIDPDRVSRVSLECLVAFVELQIMIQIRESLKSKGYSNITWRDIYSVREEYICGQSDAIKLICEMKRTAKLIDYDSTSNASNGTKRLISNESRLLTNGYSLIDDNMCSPKQSIRSKHLDHNYMDNSPYDDFEDNTESFDLLNYPIITPHSFPPSPSCHYCLPHNSSHQVTPCPPSHMAYINPPPLFAPFPINSQTSSISPKIQSLNKGVQAELPVPSNDIDNTFNKISLSNKKSMDTVDGVSAKPKTSLTNRDSLHTSVDKSAKRGSYYDNLDPFVSLEATVLSELKMNSNEKKQTEKKSPPTERNENSLEKKKLIDGKSLSKIVNSVKPNANALKLTNNANERKHSTSGSVSVTTSSQSTPISSADADQSNGKTRSEDVKCDNTRQRRGLKGWSCSTCTYLNGESVDVCEMCHRSRKLGAEVQPLVSGGRECSRCTLVNDKNEKYCRACDTSLADSPTYI